MKPGEALVRERIAELDARIQQLDQQRALYQIGPLTFRARLRFLRQDYDRLESLAKQYGLMVK